MRWKKFQKRIWIRFNKNSRYRERYFYRWRFKKNDKHRIDLTSTPIKEVMTKNFKFVKDVDLVLDVSRIMEDQKIYSLIVKNSNKKITGLIRMHEILSAKII